MNWFDKLMLIAVFTLTVSFFAGCGVENSNNDALETLKVGATPGENIELTRERYEPIVRYLENQIEIHALGHQI